MFSETNVSYWSAAVKLENRKRPPSCFCTVKTGMENSDQTVTQGSADWIWTRFQFTVYFSPTVFSHISLVICNTRFLLIYSLFPNQAPPSSQYVTNQQQCLLVHCGAVHCGFVQVFYILNRREEHSYLSLFVWSWHKHTVLVSLQSYDRVVCPAVKCVHCFSYC